jgi:glutathione S-transferase
VASPYSGKLEADRNLFIHTDFNLFPSTFFLNFHRDQPTANIPGHGLVQDSAEIAKVLEAKYPSPSTHLSNETVRAAIEASTKVVLPSVAFIVTQVPDRLLQGYDVEYFHRTREPQFGKPLKQVAAEIDETKVLADMKEAARDVVALLNKEGGPFFLGKTRWSTASALPITREEH